MALSTAFTQLRVARPTRSLSALRKFYVDGLGLAVIGSFEDHQGYTGLMIGLPDKKVHLEFTENASRPNEVCTAPTRDNLLVFYIPDKAIIDATVARLVSLGFPGPVEPENPYWADKSVTVEDPEGWRIVLVNMPGFGT